MRVFQNANFIPFDEHVRNAKARANRIYGRRATDFTDAVCVTEKPIDQVPEFAPTEPAFIDTEPMPLPEVAHLTVETIITDDVICASEVIAAKLERAKNFVSSRAFTECLHAGFFPPRCQACGR